MPALTLALAAPLSNAVTLRVANQGDVQSMDPHSLNESLQLSFTGNVYEPPVERGKDIIATSNLNVTSADDLDDAAQKIVRAVRGG